MLPSEIEPFAQAHQDDLKNIREQIAAVLSGQEGILTQGNLTIMMSKLQSTERALERFKVCMTDEVKQKESYRTKALDCRLHHK